MKQFVLLTLILVISIGANLSDNMLVRLGFDPDVLLVTLAAIVIAGLIVHRRLAFIVLVVAMTVGANLPEDLAHAWGFDPDYLLAGLIALVLTPYIADGLSS